MAFARPLALLFGVVLALAAAGCGKPPEIERYQVAKPIPLEPVAGSSDRDATAEPAEAKPAGKPTDRMLGAILPHGDELWFFKLLGAKDPVAGLEEPFTALIKSVRFAADGKPNWSLPEGWQEKPGPPPRHATLTTALDGKPLEITVSMLPNASSALQNINRWRGQLSLPPIGEEQLAAETKEIEVEGVKATLVNLVGRASSGGMRPPFMPGARDGN